MWKKRHSSCLIILCRFLCVCHPSQYLGLRQAQFGCQVGPLGQGEVLGLLEALVKCLELQAGVNGPRLPDLLPLPIQPHLPVLYHRRGLLVFWREENFPKTIINTGISVGTDVLQSITRSVAVFHLTCPPRRLWNTCFKMLWKGEIFTRKPLQPCLLICSIFLVFFFFFLKGKLVVAFSAVSSSCF